jgi:hypothetical protein
MGLLEDAIREHLDLKRKHGAPEQELERQEVEALGPARREAPGEAHQVDAEAPVGEAEAPAGPSDELVAAAEGAPPAATAPPPADAPLRAETFAAVDHAPVEEPPVEEAAVEEPPVEEPAIEEPPVDVEDDEPEPPVHDEPAAVDQPTELFDVEETLAGDTPQRGFPAQDEALDEDDDEELLAEEEGEGDVLEDTPDFLQDAPEHDRLWFEQKPPRDFDFD